MKRGRFAIVAGLGVLAVALGLTVAGGGSGPDEGAPEVVIRPVEPPEAGGATSPAGTLTLEEILSRQKAVELRVRGIAGRLALANAALCGRRVGPMVGLSVVDRVDPASITEAEAMRAVYGALGVVLAVFEGSPAAGIVAPGDRILAVDGAPFEGLEMFGAALAGDGRAALEIARDGRRLTVDVTTAPACAVPVGVSRAAAATLARSEGRVLIGKGADVALPDDRDLALAIARAMARQAVVPDTGEPDDALALAALDRRADRLGLFMLARAGYATADLAAAWFDVADRLPAILELPPEPEAQSARRGAIEAVVADLDAKAAAGDPIEP